MYVWCVCGGRDIHTLTWPSIFVFGGYRYCAHAQPKELHTSTACGHLPVNWLLPGRLRWIGLFLGWAGGRRNCWDGVGQWSAGGEHVGESVCLEEGEPTRAKESHNPSSRSTGEPADNPTPVAPMTGRSAGQWAGE